MGDLYVRNMHLKQAIAEHFKVVLVPGKKQSDAQIMDLLSKKLINISGPSVAAPKAVVKPKYISFCPGSMFYQTDQWRELRYRALMIHGGSCQCCGRKPPGIVIHVDHVKPRSKYPELELELSNLQVLCEDCNLGKSNKDETDWRPKSHQVLYEIMDHAYKFYRWSLESDHRVKALYRELINYPEAGYAPPEKYALKEKLGEIGYSTEDMIEAGLLISRDDVEVPYDLMSDVCTIAIKDDGNRVVSFSAFNRQGKDAIEYPDTPIFRKVPF